MLKSKISRMWHLVILLCCLQPGLVLAAEPQFKLHYIRKSPSWLTSVHQVTLSDIDKDGDLDWTVGNVHKNPNLYWYEYQGPDKWVEHYVGSDPTFYGGACTLDANKDGWIDLVTSELLYVNKGRGAGWSKFKIGTSDDHCHDLQAVDINQDGKLDIVSTSDKGGVNWYEAPADPTKPWILHDIGGPAYKPHAGTNPESAADLDGDGDLDVAAAQGWFENIDRKGLRWKKHDLNQIGLVGPWGAAVKTVCRDMDFDGDMDIVQSECDHRGPVGIGWLENTDGKGAFKLHWIKERVAEDFHTLAVIDYDNDGDWDIFSAVGPLAKGKKNTYIFENLSGRNKKPAAWKEHIILSGPLCHEGLAGDVDADGDIDLVLKGWTSGPFIYMENTLGRKTTTQSARDKFVTIFNGKDLTGWQTKGNWIVEQDGVLAIKPRAGEKGWKRYDAYLWAERQYGDFMFDLEFKIPKGGNSGVFVRVKDRDNPVSTGIEVQISDTYGKESVGAHDCGGIIGTIGPTKNMAKPAGQWNRMVVTCRGKQLQVELNGEKIVDVRLDTTGRSDRPLVGYVGLQDHGLPLWFRNIRIKPL